MRALGPNGLHAIFFQSQWNIVGDSLCDLFSNIVHHPEDIKGINQTLISLIPKIDNPELVRQFRPISLCSVAYKVVTKIMANRLKMIMPKVIAPS